jgi:hypothetical protein
MVDLAQYLRLPRAGEKLMDRFSRGGMDQLTHGKEAL